MSFLTRPKGGGNTEGGWGVNLEWTRRGRDGGMKTSRGSCVLVFRAAAAVWGLSACPSTPSRWQAGRAEGRRSVTGLGNEPGEQPVGEGDGWMPRQVYGDAYTYKMHTHLHVKRGCSRARAQRRRRRRRRVPVMPQLHSEYKWPSCLELQEEYEMIVQPTMQRSNVLFFKVCIQAKVTVNPGLPCRCMIWLKKKRCWEQKLH